MAALRRHAPAGWAPLVALALLAAYLITRLRVVHGLPYFLDEGLYADFSYQGAHSASQLFVTLSINKPPLQAWLAIPWQWLGINPLVAIRLVSVAAGLLTLWPLYGLGRRAGGRPGGWLTVALAVVIPFLLVNDAVGIEEPLVTLSMTAGLLLTLRLGQRGGLVSGGLLGAVLAVGILSKQSAVAGVVLIPTGLLMFDWAPAERTRRLGHWLAGAVPAAVVPIAAQLALHASHYWAAGQVVARIDPLVRSLHSVLAHPFATAPHAWRVFEPTLSGYVTIPLIVLVVLGAVLLGRTMPRLTVVLALWILVPGAAALLFTKQPYPRHLMYVLAPALVLAAVPLVEAVAVARTRLPAAGAAVLGAVVTGVLLIPALVSDGHVLARPATAHYPGLDDVQYVTGIPAGGAWPDVVAAIRREARGPRVVVFVAKADPDIVRFLLSGDPASSPQRYQVVLADQPAARHAQFAIVDQGGLPNPQALALIPRQGLVPIGRFPRPRGGPAVTLYGRPRR